MGSERPISGCADVLLDLEAQYVFLGTGDPKYEQLLNGLVERRPNKVAVKIDGEKASISWSAKVNGVDTPITQSARIIDGEWKLIDVN